MVTAAPCCQASKCWCVLFEDEFPTIPCILPPSLPPKTCKTASCCPQLIGPLLSVSIFYSVFEKCNIWLRLGPPNFFPLYSSSQTEFLLAGPVTQRLKGDGKYGLFSCSVSFFIESQFIYLLYIYHIIWMLDMHREVTQCFCQMEVMKRQALKQFQRN